MKPAKLVFHLIGNAHLDPVWLWDWREGLNEGISTCRTVLDLMDEFEELTFVRGESVIYRHIEEHDPRTFRRIVRYVEAGLVGTGETSHVGTFCSGEYRGWGGEAMAVFEVGPES
jgi:alpha-mannosidase